MLGGIDLWTAVLLPNPKSEGQARSERQTHKRGRGQPTKEGQRHRPISGGDQPQTFGDAEGGHPPKGDGKASEDASDGVDGVETTCGASCLAAILGGEADQDRQGNSHQKSDRKHQYKGKKVVEKKSCVPRGRSIRSKQGASPRGDAWETQHRQQGCCGDGEISAPKCVCRRGARASATPDP